MKNALAEGETLHVLVPEREEDIVKDDQNRLVSITREEGGLRIVLDENGTQQEHDLLIERHKDKWVVLLHANGFDVSVGVVISNDKLVVEDLDGNVLLTKAVDKVEPGMECPHPCDRCEEIYDESRGDGYCGLCPKCADETDVEFHCQDCGEEGTEDDFTPSDGNPAPHICPKCGRTNVFPKD